MGNFLRSVFIFEGDSLSCEFPLLLCANDKRAIVTSTPKTDGMGAMTIWKGTVAGAGMTATSIEVRQDRAIMVRPLSR
jgi:hypothetical protein